MSVQPEVRAQMKAQQNETRVADLEKALADTREHLEEVQMQLRDAEAASQQAQAVNNAVRDTYQGFIRTLLDRLGNVKSAE